MIEFPMESDVPTGNIEAMYEVAEKSGPTNYGDYGGMN